MTLLFSLLLTTLQMAKADAVPTGQLASDLAPLLSVISGQTSSSQLEAKFALPIDGVMQSIEIDIHRLTNGDYELQATHQDYSFVLQRTGLRTTFALPHHQVAYTGSGEAPLVDHLGQVGLIHRLISNDSLLSTYASPALLANQQVIAGLIAALVKTEFDAERNEWKFNKQTKVCFLEKGQRCQIAHDDSTAEIRLTTDSVAEKFSWTVPQDYRIIELPRQELERQLVRGVRRAFEILAPSPNLTSPKQNAGRTKSGELRWIDGHRVCFLSGSPEEIGTAHGRLLKSEALKTIDSVLYTFGTVNTIRTGRWFRHDLEAAYQRLGPHIPDDHKRETSALAASLEIDEQLAQAINVFPELFHCSGFAVFGTATKDGKLYHGRVLDYMTTIGLQDAATTFIVAVDGKIPFANVGYAGFIGSVTGMNAQAISLGEMGGGGEGQWDGVPMATLMRRALEECSTLKQVMSLWKTSPRTCEYYYVFADGKTNAAVGVAATPETIEFIQPGQAHARLGSGIEDAVVLSAGSRLEILRKRVLEKHGSIDAATAIWLMSRPVAMKSNLHNALFVPADGILYVANADHQHPAAECRYVRLDLNALLQSAATSKSVSQQE